MSSEVKRNHLLGQAQKKIISILAKQPNATFHDITEHYATDVTHDYIRNLLYENGSKGTRFLTKTVSLSDQVPTTYRLNINVLIEFVDVAHMIKTGEVREVIKKPKINGNQNENVSGTT